MRHKALREPIILSVSPIQWYADRGLKELVEEKIPFDLNVEV